MPTTKPVRCDVHSLLVISNGSYYRPVPGRYGRIPEVVIDGTLRRTTNGSRFACGDRVIVKPVRYTPFVLVHGPDETRSEAEVWESHGSTSVYLPDVDPDHIITLPSTSAWSPA